MKPKNETFFWGLHLLVLFNSSVPLILINIPLSSFQIVFLRTLLAIFFLYILVYYNKIDLKISFKQLLMFILSGIFTAMFWITIIYCARISNISVTLVGLATSPLWISVINPIVGIEKLSFHKVLIGLSAVFGIYMIFNSGFSHHLGLILAIVCGLMSALLNIINAKLAKKSNNLKLALYQTLGACLGTIIIASVSGNSNLLVQKPSWYELSIIASIAFLFSVVSYLLLLKILKHISAFNVSLAFNLSPVYGTLLAFLTTKQAETMNIYFYGGAIIIVFSVFAYPLVRFIYREQKLLQEIDTL